MLTVLGLYQTSITQDGGKPCRLDKPESFEALNAIGFVFGAIARPIVDELLLGAI